MDLHTAGQLSGYAALVFQTGSYIIQAKFPDAHTARKAVVPTHLLASISYALNGNLIPATAYLGSASRKTLYSGEFGENHKEKIATINLVAITTVTACLYERPADFLPIAGAVLATIGDMQSQGRFNRLTYLFGQATIWPAMAKMNDNTAILASNIVGLLINSKAIDNHDIKKASGVKSSSKLNNIWSDIKAYSYGIRYNAPTGASKKGQVSTNPGHEDIQKQYTEKLKELNNPYFETQNEIVAKL